MLGLSHAEPQWGAGSYRAPREGMTGLRWGTRLSRGSEGWASPYTHRMPGEEAEEHGNGEWAIALGQEGAQC